MKAERDFIVENLKEAGVRGRIHESLKSLRNCNETHAGAVLRIGEHFERSGSKRNYTDKEGQRKQRRKLFRRITVLHVVITDSDEEKVEAVFEKFLKNISKGLSVDQNWVDIEIGDADWVETEDSILRAKMAVEFDITLTGGIYMDDDIRKVTVGSIEVAVDKEE